MAEEINGRRLKIVYGITYDLLCTGGDIQNAAVAEVKRVISELRQRDRRWNLGLGIELYRGDKQGEAVGRLMRIREQLEQKLGEEQVLQVAKEHQKDETSGQFPAGVCTPGRRGYWWEN